MHVFIIFAVERLWLTRTRSRQARSCWIDWHDFVLLLLVAFETPGRLRQQQHKTQIISFAIRFNYVSIEHTCAGVFSCCVWFCDCCTISRRHFWSFVLSFYWLYSYFWLFVLIVNDNWVRIKFATRREQQQPKTVDCRPRTVCYYLSAFILFRSANILAIILLCCVHNSTE